MGTDWGIVVLRILYFTRDYTPHDHRFLVSLAESGNEVFFLRLERRGRQMEDRPVPPEVQQVQWRGGSAPFRWRDFPTLLLDLRRVIKEVQPDIIHAGPIQPVGFMAALSGFHPLMSVSWGSDLLKDAEKNRLYHWMTRFTLARSDMMLGDCQAVQDKAFAFGLSRERTVIFPWGIDLIRFSPVDTLASEEERHAAQEFRSRLGWQDNFVVLSLRSWEPIYGVDVMLRGFAQAAQEDSNLRLLMLGGGSLAPMVQRLIEENGLRDRVYLGGQVNQNDLPRMYRAADLYLSASHSDGSSVSLMEALGSGLPVLVSDIPGNREWITTGEQGWLFPDGDDRALAELLLHAAKDTQVLAAMRQASRTCAEQRADWRKNFQKLLKAYGQAQEFARPKR